MRAIDTAILSPDGASYLRRVIGSGGSATKTQILAVDSFLRGLVFDGIRSKIGRLGWFIGNEMMAATTPLIVGYNADTPIGYQYDQNCGNPPFFSRALGSGISASGVEYLSTGVPASSLSAYNIHLCAYYKRQPFNSWGVGIGFSGTGNHTMTAIGSAYNPTEQWFYAYGSPSGVYKAKTNNPAGPLFVCGSIRSESEYGATFGDSAEMVGTPSAGRVMPDVPISVFGRSSPDNGTWLRANCDLFGYSLGSSLTAAEAAKLRARMNNLRAALRQ